MSLSIRGATRIRIPAIEDETDSHVNMIISFFRSKIMRMYFPSNLTSIMPYDGHATSQCYSKLSNQKEQRDYFQAMEVVMAKTAITQLE